MEFPEVKHLSIDNIIFQFFYQNIKHHDTTSITQRVHKILQP